MGALILALIITVINISEIHLTAESVNCIKPRYHNYSEYPLSAHPCLTLDNCTQQQDTYFVSNTEFIFLPGNHQLDSQLSFENLTNLTFRGENDLNNGSVIVFAPLAHINWTDCANISIIHLTFLLSGTADTNHLFTSMQFLRSANIQLFAVTFSGGQSRLYSTAMQCYESSINISISNFHGCSSYMGAGIVGSSCSLYSNSNSFVNNSAELYGGAVAILRSKFVFTGRNSFINNRALILSGGALSSYRSVVEMRGASVFIRNSATALLSLGTGGALVITNGRLYISGDAYFISNSAHLFGGGLYAYNASVILSGSIYFERNTALHGGGISLVGNSRMYGWGLHALYCQLGIQNSL